MSHELGLVVLTSVLLLPATARAQSGASIAGVVKDTSGAVLPGVTVDASSDALIEKVRSAVSDGTGQYRIVDLRPGTYVVTFTLTGFATARREGIDVSGSGVITVNAEMRVGQVAETVIVAATTPTVDVQSTKRQEVLREDVVKSLPATRGISAIIAMIPSVTLSNFFDASSNDTQLWPFQAVFTSHGGRGNDGRVQVDGLNVGAPFNGGGTSNYTVDTAGAQELQVTLSGGLGEAETSGIHLNIVPKTGGNTFAGALFGSTAGGWSQADNVDDRLRTLGITQLGLVKNWDLNGSIGGPIKRNRLWFYANVRDVGVHFVIPGAYANLNAGDPTRWTYVEDRATPARGATATTLGSVRLTAQVTQRNKVGFFIDEQRQCDGSALAKGATGWCRDRGADWVALGNPFFSPEADSTDANREPRYVMQTTWSSPITSKLLLEAGMSRYVSRWGWMETPGGITNLIPVTQITPFFKTYRGLDYIYNNHHDASVWRASASYVTGAHSAKFGYQGAYQIVDAEERGNTNAMTYTFLFPPDVVGPFGLNAITKRIFPWEIMNRTAYHAMYAQDQWTLGRVTLQGAIRFDHAFSFAPQGGGSPVASRWNPTPIIFPRTDGVTGYNDLTPRVGVAWDVFGHGKTSVKVNLGKYLEAATNHRTYWMNNPALDHLFPFTRFENQANRIWLDFNADNTPDCDLGDPAPNFGGDFCDAWDNHQFAQVAGVVNPNILHGWGVRPWDWQLGASVQHEVVPRVSVEVGYHRRWFGNFFVADNRAVAPGDFSRVTLTAPLNPLLPGGGGYPATFYEVAPEKFGETDLFYTFETDYASARTTYWHGVDINVNARFKNGLTVQAGTSTGRGVRDTCALEAALPELIAPFAASGGAGGLPLKSQIAACHVVEPVLTQVRGLASYMIPKVDVQVAATVRSVPGTFSSVFNEGFGSTGSNGFSLNAVYTPTPDEFQAALGRSQSCTLCQYNMLLPGQMYSPRLNYVDFRAAKVLKVRRTRTLVGFDLYNLFNGNTATGLDTNYGTTFLNPTGIQTGRLARFNLTVDF